MFIAIKKLSRFVSPVLNLVRAMFPLPLLVFPCGCRCCVLSPTTEALAFEKTQAGCILDPMALLTTYCPQFFTATILEWKPLLKEDKYKDIIVNSLQFLVDNKRVKVFSFVIMPNHLHLIWQIRPGHEREEVQKDFLKYTAQKIRFDLVDNNPELLKEFEVVASDRKYPCLPAGRNSGNAIH